jgi:hypothetical protein
MVIPPHSHRNLKFPTFFIHASDAIVRVVTELSVSDLPHFASRPIDLWIFWNLRHLRPPQFALNYLNASEVISIGSFEANLATQTNWTDIERRISKSAPYLLT